MVLLAGVAAATGGGEFIVECNIAHRHTIVQLLEPRRRAPPSSATAAATAVVTLLMLFDHGPRRKMHECAWATDQQPAARKREG